MTQTGTGRADVTADLLAIQSSTLEAVQGYRRYLRNELPRVSTPTKAGTPPS